MNSVIMPQVAYHDAGIISRKLRLLSCSCQHASVNGSWCAIGMKPEFDSQHKAVCRFFCGNIDARPGCRANWLALVVVYYPIGRCRFINGLNSGRIVPGSRTNCAPFQTSSAWCSGCTLVSGCLTRGLVGHTNVSAQKTLVSTRLALCHWCC